jgi:hypothetical protein
MKVRGLTENQVQDALKEVNVSFENNLRVKRLDSTGNVVTVTINVKDSKAKGSSKNPRNGRRINAACWHAYGEFIDALFQHGAKSVQSLDNTMRSKHDNWEDWNAGSDYYPMYASEKCDC